MDRGELLDTLRTAEVLLESVPVIEREAWLETALRAERAAVLGPARAEVGCGVPRPAERTGMKTTQERLQAAHEAVHRALEALDGGTGEEIAAAQTAAHAARRVIEKAIRRHAAQGAERLLAGGG